MEYYKAYRLLAKCRTLAQKDGLNDKNCEAIIRLLKTEKGVVQAEFVPAGDYKTSVDAEFYVPVLVGESVVSVFHVVFDSVHPSQTQQILHNCELLCADLNPNPVEKITRNNTPWGIVEIHYSGFGHVDYFRPGKSTIFTDRVLQYMKPEEADAFIEKTFQSLQTSLEKSPVNWVDGAFSLDYPLFKMRVRKVESDKISHSVDGDGIWWVECPATWDFALPNVQSYLREYFYQVLISAAKPYFEERVASMESRMQTGKKIKEINIVLIKRRNAIAWNLCEFVEPGSTRDDGTRSLTFDPRLLLHPKKYIDKVVIHELCHNFELNHAKKFQELESNWCLAITGVGPHYFDDFFRTHKFVPFAPDPWIEVNHK